MDVKKTVVAALIIFILGYGMGRWESPEHLETEKVYTDVDKKTEKVYTDVDKHKKTEVKEITHPDGTKEKTTTTTEDTETHKTRNTTEVDKSRTEDKKEVDYSKAKVSIQVLGGIDLKNPLDIPAWGVAISKPILGPLTVGVFGLTNGVIGGSIGLTF